MRIIFCLLLMAPFLVKAQINRSANELAHENIREYLNTKIFKDRAYKPVYYGELKPDKEYNTNVLWAVEHRFEITEPPKNTDHNTVAEHQSYRFIFYLDKKMKVVKAEAIQF